MKSIYSPIILNATQKVLYLLILPDQRVERRKAMKRSAYANSIVQMGSLATIIVKDKGADADKPGECGIYEEFPIWLKAISFQRLETLLRLNVRLLTDAYQRENVEERADGAGNKDGCKEINHNAPVAGCKSEKKIKRQQQEEGNNPRLTIKPAGVAAKDGLRPIVTKAHKEGPTDGDEHNRSQDQPEH